MQAQIISFHCVLTDKVGTVISSTFNQDIITEGQGDFLKGLSEGLRNLQAGEKRRISLAASDAYGFYNPALVMEVSRKRFPPGSNFAIGEQVFISIKGKKLRAYRVVQATKERLNLDGNHPLAGHDLTFEVEGVRNRDATTEEMAESCSETGSLYYN